MGYEVEQHARLAWYATAPRAGAATIHQIEDWKLVRYWVARLRGKNVMLHGKWKHATREEAVETARAFRESCRAEAEALGIDLDRWRELEGAA